MGRACNWAALTYGIFMVFLQNEKNHDNNSNKCGAIFNTSKIFRIQFKFHLW